MKVPSPSPVLSIVDMSCFSVSVTPSPSLYGYGNLILLCRVTLPTWASLVLRWLSVCLCRRPGSDPVDREDSLERKCQPTPAFLP